MRVASTAHESDETVSLWHLYVRMIGVLEARGGILGSCLLLLASWISLHKVLHHDVTFMLQAPLKH